MFYIFWKKIFFILFISIYPILFAQISIDDSLSISVEDIRIEDRPQENGIYLYVRKRGEIRSVLITESAEREDNSAVTYSLRTYGYHPENGDERRILDNEFVPNPEDGGQYIIDSSSISDTSLGEVFVLFLPYEMRFGDENVRSGAINLNKSGTYISVRTFRKSYADYSGGYKDNSFYIRKSVVQTNTLETTQQFSSDVIEPKQHDKKAVESFTSIAHSNNTNPILVNDFNTFFADVNGIFTAIPQNESVDIVLVIDATRSMADDIERIRVNMPSILKQASKDRVLRIGLVTYRDINEEYLTKKYDFSNYQNFEKIINSIQVNSGGDWPEEVYAGLHVAVNSFVWQSQNKIVFLMGDAPARDPTHTTVNISQVINNANMKGIKIYPFIFPTNKKATETTQ